IIPPSPNEIARGVPLMFRAEAHDDQTGPLGYRWGAAAVGCVDGDPIPDAQSTGQGQLSGSTFTLVFEQPGPYCVFVPVTADFGAARSAVFGMRIDDSAPIASLLEVRPGLPLAAPRTTVPLYSALRFTASGSSDPDSLQALDVSWSLASPDMPEHPLTSTC